MLINFAGSNSHLRGKSWTEIGRLVLAQPSSDILGIALKACDVLDYGHDCLCMAMAYRNKGLCDGCSLRNLDARSDKTSQ
jgi:hypothetical protein